MNAEKQCSEITLQGSTGLTHMWAYSASSEGQEKAKAKLFSGLKEDLPAHDLPAVRHSSTLSFEGGQLKVWTQPPSRSHTTWVTCFTTECLTILICTIVINNGT